MKNKYIKAVFVIFAAAILCGCDDSAEPDTLGYVVAIGIDRAEKEESKFDITLQFANPSKISGGASEEGGKGGQESIENITVTAPGIYTAVNIANHIVSKTFTLSHTKLIVFSEEISRAGIEDLIETIGRSSDIRPNTYFAVSDGSAKDFLEAVNPETEVNPVRYYTMIFENDYSGFIPQNLSQDFYFFAGSEEKDSALPLCSVSKQKGTDNFDSTGYQYKLEDYSAGDVPTDKTETEVMGMAVFSYDKMVDKMGDIETEIFNILTGEYRSSYVSYYYSKAPDDPVTVLQQQEKKPKITVNTSSDSPEITIKIFLEADFNTSTPELSVEDNIAEFTNEVIDETTLQINNFLRKTVQTGTDIVGFGSYAKRNFADIDSFAEYNWKEKYKNARFNVDVEFIIRRTGLVVRSEKY